MKSSERQLHLIDDNNDKDYGIFDTIAKARDYAFNHRGSRKLVNFSIGYYHDNTFVSLYSNVTKDRPSGMCGK